MQKKSFSGHRREKKTYKFDEEGNLICQGCTSSAKSVASTKNGGRTFWACPRPYQQQCDPSFLGWCDEINPQAIAQTTGKPSSVSSPYSKNKSPEPSDKPNYQYGQVTIQKPDDKHKDSTNSLAEVLRELADLRKSVAELQTSYAADVVVLKTSLTELHCKIDNLMVEGDPGGIAESSMH